MTWWLIRLRWLGGVGGGGGGGGGGGRWAWQNVFISLPLNIAQESACALPENIWSHVSAWAGSKGIRSLRAEVSPCQRWHPAAFPSLGTAKRRTVLRRPHMSSHTHTHTHTHTLTQSCTPQWPLSLLVWSRVELSFLPGVLHPINLIILMFCCTAFKIVWITELRLYVTLSLILFLSKCLQPLVLLVLQGNNSQTQTLNAEIQISHALTIDNYNLLTSLHLFTITVIWDLSTGCHTTGLAAGLSAGLSVGFWELWQPCFSHQPQLFVLGAKAS